MSEQPKGDEGGQQRGQQAVGQLAQQTGGEGEVRAVQNGGGLAENGQPAPSGAPGGQQETGAVTGQEGRQGKVTYPCRNQKVSVHRAAFHLPAQNGGRHVRLGRQ